MRTEIAIMVDAGIGMQRSDNTSYSTTPIYFPWPIICSDLKGQLADYTYSKHCGCVDKPSIRFRMAFADIGKAGRKAGWLSILSLIKQLLLIGAYPTARRSTQGTKLPSLRSTLLRIKERIKC